MLYDESKIKALEGKKVKILLRANNNVITGYLYNRDMDYIELKNNKDSKVGSFIHKCNIVRMIEVI